MRNLYPFAFVLLLVSLSGFSCNSSDSVKSPLIEPVPIAEPKPVKAPTIHVNENGWEIPDLRKCKIQKKNIEHDFGIGNPVLLNVFVPVVQELLVTTGIGKLRVTNVREYRVKGKVYAYGLTITNPLSKDPNIANVAVSFIVTYYDMDGDGKFETSDSSGGYHPTLSPTWLKN